MAIICELLFINGKLLHLVLRQVPHGFCVICWIGVSQSIQSLRAVVMGTSGLLSSPCL